MTHRRRGGACRWQEELGQSLRAFKDEDTVSEGIADLSKRPREGKHLAQCHGAS